MADIFQEVDEEVRRDRAAALWKRYGIYVLGAAVALVLATAGWTAWRHYRNQQLADAGTQFTSAMLLANQGQEAEAAKVFAEVSAGPAEGYAFLARLETAALKLRSGDRAGAIATYDAVAADAAVPATYREAATLLSVMQQVDEGDPKALAERLGPLAADGNPWRFNAREMQGVLASRAGDTARARGLFKALSEDAAAPAALRARAAEIFQALGDGA